MCYFCIKPIYFKELININGKIITCPYASCGMKFTEFECQKCKKVFMNEYIAEIK